MTTREEQTRRRGSSFRGQLEQEIKVRLASSTKVSAPNSTPRAQGRWWEESWHPSPLFLPSLLPIHMTLRHINTTQAAWGSRVNGWEPSPFTAGDTARHPLYYPGTPQGGCSLTRGIQVRGQRGTTALLRGSISPLPAALLCRIPSSPHGLALCMGYAECGMVT